MREKAFGPESVEVARTLNSLAIVHQSLGDFKDARAYYERALAIARKTIGEDHPHAITSLNNLGSLLYDMGRFEESREVHEKCLALRERVLGPDHPDVAQSLENLGASDIESGSRGRRIRSAGGPPRSSARPTGTTISMPWTRCSASSRLLYLRVITASRYSPGATSVSRVLTFHLRASSTIATRNSPRNFSSSAPYVLSVGP